MPKLEVYVIDKRTLERILAFARGVISSDSHWDTKVVPLKNYLSDGFSPNLKKGDAIATWGILRGTGILLHEAEKKGIDFYYIDHAYFKSNNKNEEWYRIVRNGHSCTSLKFIGKDRWLNYFAKWNREYEVIEYQLALHPISNETAMNGYFDLIKEISFEYAPEYDISIILSKGGKIVKRKRINSKIK